MPEQYWIPIAMMLFSFFSFFRGYVRHKAGDYEKIYQSPGFGYGVALFILAIAAFLWMWSER